MNDRRSDKRKTKLEKKKLTIKRHALFQKHLFSKGFYTIGDLFSDARIFLKDVISHIIF